MSRWSPARCCVRGDYNTFGEDAPKGFPLILAETSNPPIAKGSGRLELANWLTQPDHPLTSRVFVNRIWYWHFGEGMVRTPDNFGRMGERRRIPNCSNYLASQFVESGWSVKALHRMIMLSNTYQMSSLAQRDGAGAADPENRLFSRFPRRRLSVEEMRDGMLAIDGTLDLTMGGTLQSGFGTDRENSSGRLSVGPESSKRREVYLPLRRRQPAHAPEPLRFRRRHHGGEQASRDQRRAAGPVHDEQRIRHRAGAES